MSTDLYTPAELADYLQVTERTLIRWRNNRTGPAWIRAGHHVRYRSTDIQVWLESQRREPVRERGMA